MSNTVIIYGSSDDLIEVAGTVSAEKQLPSDDSATLEFNSGDRVRVTYDGNWKMFVEHMSSHYTKYEVLDVGETSIFNDYTEVCILQTWDVLESVEVVDDE